MNFLPPMAVLLTRASCLAGQCLMGSFRSRPERLQGKRKPSYTVSMATQGFGSVPSTSRRTCASATSLERTDSFLKRASLYGRLYAFSTRPGSSRRGRQVACVPASPRANPRSRGGPSWGRPEPSRRNRWARDHRPPTRRGAGVRRPAGQAVLLPVDRISAISLKRVEFSRQGGERRGQGFGIGSVRPGRSEAKRKRR